MPAESSERRITYLQRKKQGYCPRCGNKVKKTSKYTYCEDCREFFRNYNKENSESIQKTRKKKYDQRKKNNQCPRCGKALGKKYGNTICSNCLNKQYKYNTGKNKPVKRTEKGKTRTVK